ncbi:cell wall hydrolase [Paremcibacter congregatus]|uniref:cell wall hydrolase n=1 Tax=Paremcibacter congregatus TaxID=2043170 RepID=UPI003A8CA7DD|tara:strand:- start:603 stop:1205 length:603 start_codon:yes stop_codon:yes gene_type:complete
MRKHKLIISIIPAVIVACLSTFYILSYSEVEASIPTGEIVQASALKSYTPANVYDADLDLLLAQLPSGVSEQEFHCLAQAVYFEARSEPFEGQVAVAYVILNRVKDKRYPDNICGVVFQNEKRRNMCQFSFACDGLSDNPYEMVAWNQARRVAGGTLKNAMSDVTARSTHYHATYVQPRWAKHLQPTIKVGQHVFYREDL